MERSFPTLLLTDGAVYRDVLPLVLGEFLRLVPAPGESGFVGARAAHPRDGKREELLGGGPRGGGLGRCASVNTVALSPF